MLVTFASCKQEKFLEINGKVVNTKTKAIYLTKMNQDMRFDSIIKIPVKDGKFHYKAKIAYPEAVDLALEESVRRGAFRYMPLFLEDEKLELTIYNDEQFDKNIVKGGELNAEYQKIKEELNDKFYSRVESIYGDMESLQKKGEYLNEAATKLLEKARKTKERAEELALYDKFNKMQNDGTGLTSKAKKLKEQLDAVLDEESTFIYNYIENNPSIIGYYFFIKKLKDLKYQKDKVDIAWAEKNHKLLTKANPNHYYNKFSLSLIEAIKNIKVGQQFVDFTAPNLKGENHTLSSEIKGKVALLDLWATWCGSCIAKSKSVLPVYEEYKDKGFTIVGVAGEFKNTENLTKFLAKNKWSWLQLVDLDRKYGIWNKYGIDNAGGSTFLIDKNGVIIAINPTAKEVRAELEKRLK